MNYLQTLLDLNSEVADLIQRGYQRCPYCQDYFRSVESLTGHITSDHWL